jgi:5'-methylthioadenosine/S-adenosylhomocysteine nucleosidase
MKYKRIAIVMAMHEEAVPLIEYFSLKKDAIYNPIEVYSNKNKSIILSLNGKSIEHGVDNIGSQAAAINAFVIIDKYKPDLIINCGTSGGFSEKKANIGDVYIAKDKVCYHDRRIPIPGGYEPYGVGNYTVINSDNIAKMFDIKQGVISTGDAFDFTETDLKMMNENNAVVKEMEAAAIAWVCSLYKVDFTAIKAITDFVDKPETTSELFLKNLALASTNL